MRAVRAMWSAMPDHLSGRILVLSALWRLRPLWRYQVLGCLYLHRMGSPMSRSPVFWTVEASLWGQYRMFLVKRAKANM